MMMKKTCITKDKEEQKKAKDEKVGRGEKRIRNKAIERKKKPLKHIIQLLYLTEATKINAKTCKITISIKVCNTATNQLVEAGCTLFS